MSRVIRLEKRVNLLDNAGCTQLTTAVGNNFVLTLRRNAVECGKEWYSDDY